MLKNLNLKNALSLQFFKKKIVRDYRKFCTKKIGHALIYYKTDSFSFLYSTKKSNHTNNWEILEMAKILNRLGFWVDIIDRSIGKNYLPEDKYDIFIGNGSGGSGKFYCKYAGTLKKAIKIFYATGMEPNYRNNLIRKRYDYFFERHPKSKNYIKYRRMANINTNQAMSATDGIFVMGSQKCIDTYKEFGKKIHRINASTSPDTNIDLSQLPKRSSKNFLYFGGNGNIVKGLDLAIEAFSELPDLNLYICAPRTEADFNDFYAEKIKKSKNIHFLGFISIGGKTFKKLTSLCPFVLQLSSTEGNSTSVATCIREGLIPIMTPESGFEEVSSSIIINTINIKNLKKIFLQASAMSPNTIARKSLESYKYSLNYTRGEFSKTFEMAIIKILLEHNFL